MRSPAPSRPLPRSVLMEFEVYVNRSKSKAFIHRADCGNLRKNGGVSPIVYYSGVKATLGAAWRWARNQHKRHTREAKCCL